VLCSILVDITIVCILCALVGGLGYCIGSWLSPRTKTLKGEIKYLEGKYNRLRQDVKDTKENEGFDLGSLLQNGGLSDIIGIIQKNPDIIQKFLGGLNQNQQKSNGFDLDKLR